MKTNVFISYGHNDFDNLAIKLKNDLMNNPALDVFFDLDSLDKGDWEMLITSGIEKCDYFLFLVSKKSISLDGYCLNELSRACELKKQIIPIMLDDSYVPLSITRLQRLMLQKSLDNEKNVIDSIYNQVFSKLIKILNKEEELGFYNRDYDFSNSLQAFDSYEILHHIKGFYGRDVIFQDFEKWISDSNSLPIYLLNAAPGIGKSAIASMISIKYPKNVAAIHFCSFNNSVKNNVKNVVKNLACQLSFRNTSYQETLTSILSKTGSLDELDSKRIFELLILEPANKLSFDTPQVLIIDGLDEAIDNGKNEIAELIVSNVNRFPSWLKFYLTSRPRKDVLLYFNSCHSYEIKELGEENSNDIKKYYYKSINDINDNEIDILLNKTHGSFLYAKTIVKNIKSGELSISNVKSFPDGIYSYYGLWFDRLFDKGSISYDDAKKILSLLQVSTTSPDIDFLIEATEFEEEKIMKILSALSSFINVNENIVKARHKSILDWLSNNEKCPSRYYISLKSSYNLLLMYITKKRESGRRWKKDIHVIKDYSQTLKYLKKYDELYDLLIDKDYQYACVGSSFYTLYEALSEYITNLKFLYDEDEDYAYDIYESECFIEVFSKYRMKIYNSGLFIQLKKCGFEDYLKENNDKNFGLEFELGELHFYYISLSFILARKQIERIVANYPLEEMDVNHRSELERMMMLVYRKLVMFKELEDIANSTICDARAADNKFEESLAYLTLSKVYCRELRKEDCYNASNMAIKILKEKVDLSEDDSKIQDALFLAEDYRVAADACIWLNDYDKAIDFLAHAESIYAYYNQYDRYYPRYLYTSLFLEIVTNNEVNKIEKLIAVIEELLNKSNDEYDKAQLKFLTSLYTFKNANSDILLLNKALDLAKEAIAFNNKLSIPLERLEAECLANHISTALGQGVIYTNEYNSYTNNWITYVNSYLEDVIK